MRTIRDRSNSHGTSAEDIAKLGLPSGSPNTATQASVPVAVVDTSVRMRHTISWTYAGTPGSKRWPHNARSAEIWQKIDGPPPVDVSECRFVADDTAPPYEVHYSGEDGGKIVHYMLRDGTFSGWGDTVSATIPA